MLLLDVEEHDSVAISHRITTQLVTEDQIQQQDFGAVMRTLLLRRQHVADHQSRGLRNYMSSRNLSRATLQVSRSVGLTRQVGGSRSGHLGSVGI